MREILGSSDMKECDQYTIGKIGIPSLVLMERAALSVVEEIEKDYNNIDISAIIFAGIGNNGGDGIAIGRILWEKGMKVKVVVIGNMEKCSKETKSQLEIAEKLGLQIEKNSDYKKGEYNVVVDALFGIGISRTVEGVFGQAIEAINSLKQKARVYAVDIPSGIHTDTGEKMGVAVLADKTITFQYEKSGLYLQDGRKHAGEVIVKDIGISKQFLKEKMREPYIFMYERRDLEKIPKRNDSGNKGTFGRVLIIAGSKNMAGAAFFSADAAYRTGCGLVEVFTPEENRIIIQEKIPEAVLTTYDKKDFLKKMVRKSMEKADVIIMGPGLGTSKQAEELVEYVIKESEKPCVVDADALNILAEHLDWLEQKKAECILTPHLKELSRLCKKEVNLLKKECMTVTLAFSEKYDCVVVAKDARTITVEKKKQKCCINVSGCNGMATAGSGDVLTGIIGGLLAQKMRSYEAASMGVYVHGLAGEMAEKDLGNYSMKASDIINNIHKIIN